MKVAAEVKVSPEICHAMGKVVSSNEKTNNLNETW